MVTTIKNMAAKHGIPESLIAAAIKGKKLPSAEKAGGLWLIDDSAADFKSIVNDYESKDPEKVTLREQVRALTEENADLRAMLSKHQPVDPLLRELSQNDEYKIGRLARHLEDGQVRALTSGVKPSKYAGCSPYVWLKPIQGYDDTYPRDVRVDINKLTLL